MESRKLLRAQLQDALDECERLRKENARLRKIICDLPEKATTPHEPDLPNEPRAVVPSVEIASTDFSPEIKVTLFRNLFRGREDVYAVRWDGKNGRSGYSPACAQSRDTFFYISSKLKSTDRQDRE